MADPSISILTTLRTPCSVEPNRFNHWLSFALRNCPYRRFGTSTTWPAYALQGDTAKARAAYQDFLRLWKDADPDIPILKQAKAEYAKLH
jgi:hypothetical protein